jgi:hypothetical protein
MFTCLGGVPFRTPKMGDRIITWCMRTYLSPSLQAACTGRLSLKPFFIARFIPRVLRTPDMLMCVVGALVVTKLRSRDHSLEYHRKLHMFETSIRQVPKDEQAKTHIENVVSGITVPADMNEVQSRVRRVLSPIALFAVDIFIAVELNFHVRCSEDVNALASFSNVRHKSRRSTTVFCHIRVNFLNIVNRWQSHGCTRFHWYRAFPKHIVVC